MTAPGWYTDGSNHSTERYWDGNGWTEQTRPAIGAGGYMTAPLPVVTPHQPNTEWYKQKRYAISAAVAVVVIIFGVIGAVAGTPDDKGSKPAGAPVVSLTHSTSAAPTTSAITTVVTQTVTNSASTTPVSPTTTGPKKILVPDVVHFILDSAELKVGAAGIPDSVVSETTVGQNSVVLLPENWIVLDQTPKAGTEWKPGTLVHLQVVKLSDPMAAGITPRG